MLYREISTVTASLLLSFTILCAGCASGVEVTNTLPEQLKDRLQTIETDQGVDLRFTPIPAGEQFSVSVGAMDYSLNRVFEGMLIEMLTTKFDTLQNGAQNVVDVQINYLNVQEENYGGTLNRMDMAVTVGLSDGFRTTERELSFSEKAEVDGYGLQSGQIRNLLLRFALEINQMVDERFIDQGVSQQ
jgi:hypothetical protein